MTAVYNYETGEKLYIIDQGAHGLALREVRSVLSPFSGNDPIDTLMWWKDPTVSAKDTDMKLATPAQIHKLIKRLFTLKLEAGSEP